jgi:hypothetical protein
MEMRTFVKYNRDGVVLSVAKVRIMPAQLEHPFADLADGDGVLEVSGPLADVDTAELHNGYQIDVKKQQLVKKPPSTPPPAGPVGVSPTG